MLGNYEIFKDKAGKFRFRLVASNGQIIAASEEGFESRQICENTIEQLRTCVLEAKVLDFTARACPACDAMIRADSNFCDQCGTHVDWQPNYTMMRKCYFQRRNHRETWIEMPRGLPAPQFEIRMLWIKWIENGVVKQAWNMLQDVGSPEPRHTHTWPTIPEWNQRMGGFNFQIEATIVNKTSATLNLKFRTQTCPRGTSGLPPMPRPPCGDLVDSGAAVTVGPYGTGLMPVFQLRMWGKNIDQHCEIVDANDQTVYNCLVPYRDNAEYRADDWYIPIDSAVTAAIPRVTLGQRLWGTPPKYP